MREDRHWVVHVIHLINGKYTLRIFFLPSWSPNSINSHSDQSEADEEKQGRGNVPQNHRALGAGQELLEVTNPTPPAQAGPAVQDDLQMAFEKSLRMATKPSLWATKYWSQLKM